MIFFEKIVMKVLFFMLCFVHFCYLWMFSCSSYWLIAYCVNVYYIKSLSQKCITVVNDIEKNRTYLNYYNLLFFQQNWKQFSIKKRCKFFSYIFGERRSRKSTIHFEPYLVCIFAMRNKSLLWYNGISCFIIFKTWRNIVFICLVFRCRNG